MKEVGIRKRMTMGSLSSILCMAILILQHVDARPLVRSIKSANEFDRVIAKHAKDTGLPVIVDFYSDGCGPCRQMAPVFKRLAKEHENDAVFIKVDTNRIYEVSSRYSVRSIPTFISFVNGKKTEEFSGAGEGQLRQMTDRAVDRAKYDNIKLELEDLVEYYQKKDASKTRESVESVHKKCADMGKNKEGECAGAAAQKLAKNLRKKYKEAPKLQPKFTAEQQKGASADQANGSSNTGSTTGSHKQNQGSSSQPNLHLASTDALREELDRRLEAEAEAAEDEEDDDDESDPHGWSRSDWPERVTILGGGPAGLSAAIYAARAGLAPVVVAPPMGGQLQGKGVDVENYPGLSDVTGPAVVAAMREQAARFGARFLSDTGRIVDVTQRPLRITTNTTEDVIETHTVIVATGAESNWLGVKGEYEMRGGGVSTCATCDGHFFKDTHVVVVGGGDTAMEDALVLARTSKRVTIVHRRDTFRASKVLAERVMNHPSISVRWNTTLQEIIGETIVASSHDEDDEDSTTDLDDSASTKKLVTGVVLKDKFSGNTVNLQCKAVFVAIGHTPTTQILEGVVEFDPDHANYVKTYGDTTKTSVEGIYAAGDVADAVYRQAVTSAGSGAAAALDAERWLSEQGLGNEAAEFEAELLRELMEDLPGSSGSGAESSHNVYDSINTKGYKESMSVEL